MGNNSVILKGNIFYSQSATEIAVFEHAYLVCQDGVSKGVYKTLPAEYQSIPLTDCGDLLIIPGLTDLHLHAPQFTYRGLGMDMELLEWLNVNTFPEEANYANLEYAKEAYELFTEDIQWGATTRACVFATIHTDATMLLMDMLDKAGLCAYVGKVNMDRNAPEYLCEKDAMQSASDTEKWIKQSINSYENVKPIVTPRFVPSCSDELMKKLGQLAREYQIPVQSHLSENPSEIAWVKELAPWAASYTDVYARTGLLGDGVPTIMAHCIYCSDEEIKQLSDSGTFVAHCPMSNMNIASGVAPVRTYLDKGMHIGLGTDVAGGYSSSILRAMADSIQVSKLRWRLLDDSKKPVTLEEAFFMGTKGGGAFFGQVGSFEKDYLFDAVVIDDSSLVTPRKLSLHDRLERAVYMSESCKVVKKYVNGISIL